MCHIANKMTDKLEDMLKTYINMIISYRLCLTHHDTTFLVDLEKKRYELHTTILKELGCSMSTSREMNCKDCSFHNDCIKMELAHYIEKNLGVWL